MGGRRGRTRRKRGERREDGSEESRWKRRGVRREEKIRTRVGGRGKKETEKG